MKLKSLFRGILFIIIMSLQLFSFEIKSDTDAIKAMGHGMSKMRNMLETYAMVGMGICYKYPEKRLSESIREYESIIRHMQQRYKDKKIQESIERSKKAWVPLKKAFENIDRDAKEQMKKDALFAHANIRTVIKEMAFIKKYLVDKSQVKDLKALNAAIEIATSSQRLSAHYMMKLWELDDPTIKQHWNKGIDIYKTSVKYLKTTTYYKSNRKFKNALDSCEKKLLFYNFIFGQKAAICSLVDKKSQEVFQNAKILINIIIPKI